MYFADDRCLASRYWQPNESIFPSAQYDESFNRDYTPRPSYDSALTAYAQLGALRCNAKRGMISVVDQHSQYIIAEGTKTLSLQDGSVIDHDDELWFGLRTIPRQMGICATALGQFTMPGDESLTQDAIFQPLQFVIPDLSKDSRFENQPFVCGVPYLRFYAGVPIYSPAGYIIGIYSIVDDKPREDFGERDLNVLKDLAATVMDHLVLGTVRSRHQRAERMVKGLGLFVEGKSTLRDWWVQSGHLAQGPTTKDGSRGELSLKAQAEAEFGPEDAQMVKLGNHEAMRAQDGPVGLRRDHIHKLTASLPVMKDTFPDAVPSFQKSHTNGVSAQDVIQVSLLGLVNGSTANSSPPPERNASGLQANVSLEPTQPVDDNVKTEAKGEIPSTSQGIKAMLSRASNVIRESIEVEGCLFLDASALAFKSNSVQPPDDRRDISISQPEPPFESEPECESKKSGMVDGSEDDAAQEVQFNDFEHSASPSCEVLGCSLKFGAHVKPNRKKDDFRFSHDFLRRLLKRYPNGHIFNFESDGRVSSSENDTESSPNDQPPRENRRARKRKSSSSLEELDAQSIRDALPGIRCLAFFPLREPTTNSWVCGSFAWTNDPMRVLNHVDDLAYLAAFGNSIMAEKSRLEAALADKMKNNFLSTVSHELRSPLHGILAGAELLKDLSTTVAQSDVVHMIHVCGRTLLDTINHVLDFTELNRSGKTKSSIPKPAGEGRLPSQDNVLSRNPNKEVTNIDLSKLIEEAVDTTVVGFDFSQSEAAAFLNIDHQRRALEFDKPPQQLDALSCSPSRIHVILDMEARSSWTFTSIPGAWRRILMNLLGNSLKYTKSGYIYVSLRSMPGKHGRPSIILSVKDTGEGISAQFLKHHAFTPFVQEDSLATGTGLGLSIVERIVHDMNGEISIKSEKGVGTQVEVQVSLAQPSSGSGKPSNDKGDNDIASVRAKLRGMRVRIVSSSSILDRNRVAIPTQRSVAVELSSVISEAAQLRDRALIGTLTHWFDLQVVRSSSMLDGDADLYLLLEDGPEELARSQWTSGGPSYPQHLTDLVIKQRVIVLNTAASVVGNGSSELWKSTPFVQQP